jgi:hypothetical protein
VPCVPGGTGWGSSGMLRHTIRVPLWGTGCSTRPTSHVSSARMLATYLAVPPVAAKSIAVDGRLVMLSVLNVPPFRISQFWLCGGGGGASAPPPLTVRLGRLP